MRKRQSGWRTTGRGHLSFRPVVPQTEDVERPVVQIGEAYEPWLSDQGFGLEASNNPGEDDAQAVIQPASLLGLAETIERPGRPGPFWPVLLWGHRSASYDRGQRRIQQAARPGVRVDVHSGCTWS